MDSKGTQPYIYLHPFLPSRLPHDTGQSSLSSTVGPCWLPILNRAVCTCPSQTIRSPHPIIKDLLFLRNYLISIQAKRFSKLKTVRKSRKKGGLRQSRRVFAHSSAGSSATLRLVNQPDPGFYIVLALPIHMALVGNLLTLTVSSSFVKWRHRVHIHSPVARAK